MSATIPCRRCHRLRSLNPGGYCGSCTAELRANERRRPAGDPVVIAALTPSLAPPDDVLMPPPAVRQVADAPPPAEALPATSPVQAGEPPPPPAIPLSPAVVPVFVLTNLDEDGDGAAA